MIAEWRQIERFEDLAFRDRLSSDQHVPFTHLLFWIVNRTGLNQDHEIILRRVEVTLQADRQLATQNFHQRLKHVAIVTLDDADDLSVCTAFTEPQQFARHQTLAHHVISALIGRIRVLHFACGM